MSPCPDAHTDCPHWSAPDHELFWLYHTRPYGHLPSFFDLSLSLFSLSFPSHISFCFGQLRDSRPYADHPLQGEGSLVKGQTQEFFCQITTYLGHPGNGGRKKKESPIADICLLLPFPWTNRKRNSHSGTLSIANRGNLRMDTRSKGLTWPAHHLSAPFVTLLPPVLCEERRKRKKEREREREKSTTNGYNLAWVPLWSFSVTLHVTMVHDLCPLVRTYPIGSLACVSNFPRNLAARSKNTRQWKKKQTW